MGWNDETRDKARQRARQADSNISKGVDKLQGKGNYSMLKALGVILLIVVVSLLVAMCSGPAKAQTKTDAEWLAVKVGAKFTEVRPRHTKQGTLVAFCHESGCFPALRNTGCKLGDKGLALVNTESQRGTFSTLCVHFSNLNEPVITFMRTAPLIRTMIAGGAVTIAYPVFKGDGISVFRTDLAGAGVVLRRHLAIQSTATVTDT